MYNKCIVHYKVADTRADHRTGTQRIAPCNDLSTAVTHIINTTVCC
jgi:hypothetical protein